MLMCRLIRPATPLQNSYLINPRFLIPNTSLKYATTINKHRLYSTQSKGANTNKNQTNKQNSKKSSRLPSKWWSILNKMSTFTLSSALVITSIGLTTMVLYLIGKELFSPNGDTQLFNRSVTLVQDNEQVRKLLQCQDSLLKKEKLKAYGELVSHDKWTRNRPIVSKRRLDKDGNVHCFIRFHLQSKEKIGLVHVETMEIPGKFKPKFNCIYIDVPGNKRFFIIKPKLNNGSNTGNSSYLNVNNILTKPFDFSWWKK